MKKCNARGSAARDPHGIKQITVGPPHGIKQITMFIRENVDNKMMSQTSSNHFHHDKQKRIRVPRTLSLTAPHRTHAGGKKAKFIINKSPGKYNEGVKLEQDVNVRPDYGSRDRGGRPSEQSEY
ncbi:hypothetical protein J6590_007658 [Homalodisca vitripennis]|nr:hypothetical protein J6590_007658 [Homalodisca vitripennis]